MACLEPIMSPSVQMPASERLKNCPRYLVEAHSWAFLAPLHQASQSLLFIWEDVFRIFPLQDIGQRQLKLIQLLQSSFHPYPSGTHVATQYTHSDAENWSFFFPPPFLSLLKINFWQDQFPELIDTVIALMWVQENGMEDGNRRDGRIIACQVQFCVSCLLGFWDKLHLWWPVGHKFEDNVRRKVQQKKSIDWPPRPLEVIVYVTYTHT